MYKIFNITIFLILNLFNGSVMSFYVRPPGLELNETKTEKDIAKRFFFAVPLLGIGVKMASAAMAKAVAAGKLAGAMSAIGSKISAISVKAATLGGHFGGSFGAMTSKLVKLAKISHSYAGKLKVKVEYIKDNLNAAKSMVDKVTGIIYDVKKKTKSFHGKLSGIVGYQKIKIGWPLRKFKEYGFAGRKNVPSPAGKLGLVASLYRLFCGEFTRRIDFKNNAISSAGGLCGVRYRGRSLEGTSPKPLDQNVTTAT